jgi:hypothetical protein
MQRYLKQTAVTRNKRNITKKHFLEAGFQKSQITDQNYKITVFFRRTPHVDDTPFHL